MGDTKKVIRFYEALDSGCSGKRMDKIFNEAVNEIKTIYKEKSKVMSEDEKKTFQIQTVKLLREMDDDLKKATYLGGISLGAGIWGGLPVLMAITSAYLIKYFIKRRKEFNELVSKNKDHCKKKFLDEYRRNICIRENIEKKAKIIISDLEKIKSQCAKSDHPRQCFEKTNDEIKKYQKFTKKALSKNSFD